MIAAKKNIWQVITAGLGPPLVSILLALIAGGGFILAIGQNPLQVYSLLFRETFGHFEGFGFRPHWFGLG